jgi:hypothetical protein
MGMLLVVLLGGRKAAAAEPKPGGGKRGEPIKLHLFLAAGGVVGHASEKRNCYEEGAYDCPFDETRESLGVQAAPFAEAVVMGGKSRGLRFGLGARYLPPVALSEGGELHLPLVQEIVFDFPGGLVGSVRLFAAIMLDFPSAEAEARQAEVTECRIGPRPSGSSCDDRGTTGVGISVSPELFLHQDFDGTVVRYGIGWQFVFFQNNASGMLYSGSDPANAPDELSYTREVEGSRFVAMAGVEW